MIKLRRDICLGTLDRLSTESTGYHASMEGRLGLLQAHGYNGVVAWGDWEAIGRAGLTAIGMARVVEPADAEKTAHQQQHAGVQFTTLHVGTGFESDEEMARLGEAVLEASAATGHPMHIETHRGTMTQDIKRTLDLVERFPELPFTLDFSHWYTGHEMTYGGEFEERLARLDPFFASVRSIQVRVGDTGRIQRPFDEDAHYLTDHMSALRRCVESLNQHTDEDTVLSIAPELLPAKMDDPAGDRWICYAELEETSDRFEDALKLSRHIEDKLHDLVT
ncbi:MAG: hypothetical protein AAF830_01190 [Pseudomonadota bacterium]